MKNVIELIKSRLDELGFHLNPTSRLGKQINVYVDPKGTLPQILEPNHELFQTAVEGERDLKQVAYALKHLVGFPPEELRKRLRLMVADAVLPQDSPQDSPGRDAQFELFVAAACVKGGLVTVFDEKPDLRCDFSGISLGVAIKRIKAPPETFENRLQQRVREAGRQIEESGIPGVIVADISQSLNPTNWRIPLEVNDARFDAAVRSNWKSFRSRFEHSLTVWTKGKPVRGIVLLDHVLRSLPNDVWRLELSFWSKCLSPHNQRRRREFERFDTCISEALMNPGPIVG